MNLIFLSIGEGLSNLSENAIYPDLLRCFQDHGHHVYIVCQRERRSGLPTERKTQHGIEVLNVKTGNITKTNLIEKGIATLLLGYRYKNAINKYYKKIKFDLVLYTTPPITIANTVKFLKNRDNAFAYLMLKDIFPQNALDLGILKKSGWKRIITKCFLVKEKELYRVSDMIGCMSEVNAKYLKNNNPYLDDNKIEVCPNTITPSPVFDIDKIYIKEKFNLPYDKLIFICGGNFGKPQNVDFIIDVLINNKGRSDRHFVMCGSGTEFYKLKEYSKTSDDNCVTIIDNINKEEFNQLLEVCDVGLIFLDHRFTIPNFPSRLLDYMNHCMPVFAATDRNTDLGEVITSEEFGWWCESNNVNEYTRILDEICANPFVIDEMKINSRSCLVNNFSTKISYEIILNAYMKKSK